jgi:hypothetical protein
MREVAKEALAHLALALDTAPQPADECAQYALLECVWVLDTRQTPWLLAVHSSPSYLPASNVDRHVKESLMKDLYGILIAPVVEEAAVELGSFVQL